jgi:flagellar hook protein FlgE
MSESGGSAAGGWERLCGDGSVGVGGRATIEDAALGQSNADRSAEFSDSIVAQLALKANSKPVTTFDSVTQEAVGTIR